MTFFRTLIVAVVLAILPLDGTWGDVRKPTGDDVKALTLKAADLIAREGLDRALELFNVQGEFRFGEIYVNVINGRGIWLCYPPKPENVGRSVVNVMDVDGRYIVQDILDTARRGEGWVTYRWMNPATRVVQRKHTFVKSLPDQNLVVYIGWYE